MATARQQFTEYVIEAYAKCNMLATLSDVAEQSALGAVVILAKPDIGKHRVSLSFRSPDWVVEPTLWHGSWWARLLRKVEHWARRRWGRPFLPTWLDSLVYSKSITAGYKKESLPVDAIERIAAMANYLRHYEKVQPSKVLLGCKAMRDLKTSPCTDYWPDPLTYFENPNEIRVFDLETQISPFLAEDEILVV